MSGKLPTQKTFSMEYLRRVTSIMSWGNGIPFLIAYMLELVLLLFNNVDVMSPTIDRYLIYDVLQRDMFSSCKEVAYDIACWLLDINKQVGYAYLCIWFGLFATIQRKSGNTKTFRKGPYLPLPISALLAAVLTYFLAKAACSWPNSSTSTSIFTFLPFTTEPLSWNPGYFFYRIFWPLMLFLLMTHFVIGFQVLIRYTCKQIGRDSHKNRIPAKQSIGRKFLNFIAKLNRKSRKGQNNEQLSSYFFIGFLSVACVSIAEYFVIRNASSMDKHILNIINGFLIFLLVVFVIALFWSAMKGLPKDTIPEKNNPTLGWIILNVVRKLFELNVLFPFIAIIIALFPLIFFHPIMLASGNISSFDKEDIRPYIEALNYHVNAMPDLKFTKTIVIADLNFRRSKSQIVEPDRFINKLPNIATKLAKESKYPCTYIIHSKADDQNSDVFIKEKSLREELCKKIRLNR